MLPASLPAKNLKRAHKKIEIPISWRALQVFTLYRFFVASGLLALYELKSDTFFVGLQNRELFLAIASFYWIFAVITIFCAIMHWPKYHTQVFVQVILDILILTILIHASSRGAIAELGILMNAAIAGGSILTIGRTSIFFAAIASILILLEHGYASLKHIAITVNYTQIGIVGITFFATSILGYTLSRRIRISEILAKQRGEELAHSERVNRYIVQQIRSGIIVIDQIGNVELINDAACKLLGVPNDVRLLNLMDISKVLARQIALWKDTKRLPIHSFKVENSGAQITVQFIPLGDEDGAGTVIFIEDTLLLAQQAQQMKLASLGRLTASIAHEIRNPLGAVSHAAQLLEESVSLNEQDVLLVKIIHQQSVRMNSLINNVLQLSRRKKPELSLFRLKPWLNEFRDNFSMQSFNDIKINVEVDDDKLEAYMDINQLHQVLTNLCENGLRYSYANIGKATITLHAGFDIYTQRTYLDIIDQGKLVDEKVARKMFEPFFTTEKSGTGLGLYLAKEICEINSAQLDFQSTSRVGNLFRITFFSPKTQG